LYRRGRHSALLLREEGDVFDASEAHLAYHDSNLGVSCAAIDGEIQPAFRAIPDGFPNLDWQIVNVSRGGAKEELSITGHYDVHGVFPARMGLIRGVVCGGEINVRLMVWLGVRHENDHEDEHDGQWCGEVNAAVERGSPFGLSGLGSG
jgi:hypothetical protein